MTNVGGTVMAKVSCHFFLGGNMLEKHWSSGEYSHQNYPLRPLRSLVPSLPPPSLVGRAWEQCDYVPYLCCCPLRSLDMGLQYTRWERGAM